MENFGLVSVICAESTESAWKMFMEYSLLPLKLKIYFTIKKYAEHINVFPGHEGSCS